MKRFATLSAALLLFTALSIPAMAAKSIKAMGGMAIPGLGLEIDASYDPRLDTLAEGYKVVNAAMVNGSFSIVMLDPDKDKWTVKTADGTSVKAIVNLRKTAPKVWAKIPEKARELMGYPLVLPIASKQNIDLFVPSNVDLTDMNEISVYLKSIDTRIDVAVGP